jgi:hypothetical protein
MTRTRKAAQTPAVEYPDGYFTALVRQHDWPPQFKPAVTVDRRLDAQNKATRQMLAAGKGFASVTLGLPGAAEHIQRWRHDRPAAR